MAKAIVTGAAGFLGSFVVHHLAERGWEVSAVDREWRQGTQHRSGQVTHAVIDLPSPAWVDLLSRVKPDAVVHLAGPASVPASVEDPWADFEGSVRVWYWCLEKLRRLGNPCRVLYCSSAAVYGNPATLPMQEDDPLCPVSPYGLNKLLCEMAMERFHDMYGLPVAAVRVFSAYGEGLRRQLVWDVCRKALSEPVVELHGTGEESRDFVYGADVAHGVLQVLERGAFRGEAYNLATGRETTVRELAELVLRQLGVGKELRFSGAGRQGDPARWRSDISRISELGYHPEVAIEEGLERVAAWAQRQLS